MKKNKNKILVLTDLKNSAESELKSAVSLAKMTASDIMILHVQRPTDLVDRESQLSAMRTINQEHLVGAKRMQEIAKPYMKDRAFKIGSKIVIGNLKNEVEAFLKIYQPDTVVIGKKKTKAMSIIGDNLTKFIMNKHSGSVMIAANNALHTNNEVSLGVLNPNDETVNLEVMEGLLHKVKEPIKAFNISNNGKSSLKEERTLIGKKAIEYIFDDANQAIESVSRYASKNNINLMCIDKTEINIKNLLNKLTISVLLTEKQPAMLYN